MNDGFKKLLVAEAVVCFTPSVAFLMLGVLMVPRNIHELFENPLHWDGPLIFIWLVFSGIAGIAALVLVLWKLQGNGSIERPVPVLVAIALAVAPLIGAAVGADSTDSRIVTSLPLFATVHILTSARRMFLPLLKPHTKPNIWSWIWLGVPLLIGAVALVLAASANQSHDELIERRVAWLEARPPSYSYHLAISGWMKPGDLLLPTRITVRDNEITSAVHAISLAPGAKADQPPATELAWTMDMVFDELIKAKTRGARVRARFNERSGFVEGADIEFDAPNSQWSLEIRDFQPQHDSHRRAVTP